MKAIGRRRLLELAEFLATKVPRRRFNMGTWISNEGGNRNINGRPELHNCGYSACAVGWAACRFKRQLVMTEGLLSFKNFGIGQESICEFFEIETEQMKALFLPLTCPCDICRKAQGARPSVDATPKQMAKRIREFVKREDAAAAV